LGKINSTRFEIPPSDSSRFFSMCAGILRYHSFVQKFNKNAKSRARASPKDTHKTRFVFEAGISACCFASGSPFFTGAPADVDTTQQPIDFRRRADTRLAFRWDQND